MNLNNLDFGEKEEEKINIEENEGLPNEEDREINRPKFRDERQRRRRRKGNKEKTNNQEKIKKERKRKKKKKNNGDGLNFERDGELEI